MIWDRPSKPILHVCCNDPDNGLFTGRVARLNIGRAELEPHTLYEPRFAVLSNGDIRLSGKCWPVTHSKEWLGNWCWNGYRIGDGLDGKPTKTTGWWMVDFATWLRGRNLFTCTHGPCDFFDWFNHEREMTPAEVHGAVFDTVDF